MYMTPMRQTYRGFTLLELLTVIAIIGILMSGALISIRGVGRAARFEGAARTIKDKIVLARTASITRGRRFAVHIRQTDVTRRWVVEIIDSVDNILDNDNDRLYEDSWFLPRQVESMQEYIIEFSPEGSITFASDNPIQLRDISEANDVWLVDIVLYRAPGTARVMDVTKETVATVPSPDDADEEDVIDMSLEEQFGLTD